MKNLRRLENFVINRQQVRWLLLIAGVSAICYFVLATVVAASFYKQIAYASQDFEVQPIFTQKLYVLMQSSILALTVTALILTVVTTLAAMILSHRFFGPLVPIKRFINSVKDGDYSVRLSLRNADELHDLAQDLNEMAIALEKRYEK